MLKNKENLSFNPLPVCRNLQTRKRLFNWKKTPPQVVWVTTCFRSVLKDFSGQINYFYVTLKATLLRRKYD